jgi:pimeloyl-ACP methyl ester carboxylesterase
VARSIEIQGEPLAVEVFEPARHLGDALLIHGYTGSKEDFAEVGPFLAARGYRVVAFDNRGQHESAHSDRDDAYTIPSLARDAIALADHFALDRPHLLGHSFGGLVAQRAVVMLPGRWASLTLFCTGPHGRFGLADLTEMIDVLETHSMEEAWDPVRDADARRSDRYDVLKRRWTMSDPRSVVTHAKHLLTEPSIVEQVHATGLPVHVVYGERDDAWPLDMQDQMARDLDAPVTVIPDAGHCPNEDRPGYTAEVIAEFWDKTPYASSFPATLAASSAGVAGPETRPAGPA